MRFYKTRKVALLVLVFTLFCSTQCFAQDLTFIQKLIYKKVYVLEPSGRQTLALVNRFNDKAEYIHAIDRWIKTPAHIQYCYKNRAIIQQRLRRY